MIGDFLGIECSGESLGIGKSRESSLLERPRGLGCPGNLGVLGVAAEGDVLQIGVLRSPCGGVIGNRGGGVWQLRAWSVLGRGQVGESLREEFL